MLVAGLELSPLGLAFTSEIGVNGALPRRLAFGAILRYE
jgi:hypothetical protein